MVTAAVVLRLARGRTTPAPTLQRFFASCLPLLSFSSSSTDHLPGSSIGSFSRLQSFAYNSAVPEDVDGDWGNRIPPPEPEGKFPPHSQTRKGDWICPRCSFMNFARNFRCLRCREDGPKREQSGYANMREGDWICPGCNFMNFARNMMCLKCRTNRPNNDNTRVSSRSSSFGRLESSDWLCPTCQYVNFARNSICHQCEGPRPSVQLKDGEWECPSCKFLNLSGNSNCLRCNQSCSNNIRSEGDSLSSIPELAADGSLMAGDVSCSEENIDSLEDPKKNEDAVKY